MLLRRLKTVSVKLPKEVVELLDMLVVEGGYYSRSQIIRRALIEFLKNTMNTDTHIPEQKFKQAIRALKAIDILT